MSCEGSVQGKATSFLGLVKVLGKESLGKGSPLGDRVKFCWTFLKQNFFCFFLQETIFLVFA